MRPVMLPRGVGDGIAPLRPLEESLEVAAVFDWLAGKVDRKRLMAEHRRNLYLAIIAAEVVCWIPKVVGNDDGVSNRNGCERLRDRAVVRILMSALRTAENA